MGSSGAGRGACCGTRGARSRQAMWRLGYPRSRHHHCARGSAGGQRRRSAQPKSGICSAPRSAAGSRPRNGSRSPSETVVALGQLRAGGSTSGCASCRPRSTGAAAATARACSGPAPCAQARSTRNRTSRSSGGMRAWRRRTGSPSIAVHSSSNANATFDAHVPDAGHQPRAPHRGARATDVRFTRSSRSSSRLARRSPRERPRLVAHADPDLHARAGGRGPPAARRARRARGCGAGSPRLVTSRSGVDAMLR